MGESAEELRRDIERTRGELSGTLGAIEDKVSPQRIVERRKEAARNRMSSVRESVMGVADSVRGSAGGVADRGGSALQGVAGAPSAAADTLKGQARGNPLLAGLVAFGAGVLLGSVLPASQIEQDAVGRLQDQLEPMKEQAKTAVQEVASNLQAPAQEAVDHVKDSATQAAQQVKEEATGAAQDVRDQAQSSTEEVRQQAQTSTEQVRDQAGATGSPQSPAPQSPPPQSPPSQSAPQPTFRPDGTIEGMPGS